MLASTLSPLEVVLLALVVALLLILVYKFLTRAKPGLRVGTTRWGVFVERDPFVEPPELGEADTHVWPSER